MSGWVVLIWLNLKKMVLGTDFAEEIETRIAFRAHFSHATRNFRKAEVKKLLAVIHQPTSRRRI